MDEAVAALTRAATAFVDAAGPATVRPFDDERRSRWTYLPGRRDGISMAELDRPGAQAVHRLLAATVSRHAHAQVTAIMGLEDPLSVEQGRDRHMGDYWVAVHGSPGDARWSWRLEGHHVSVRATVVDGVLRPTPLFLGANPARILHDGIVTSQPLAPEELLGFRLLHDLGDRARRQAVVAEDAPQDILTGDDAVVDALPQDQGVRLGDLNGEARRLAERLVEVYPARLVPPLRRRYTDEVLPQTLGDVRFAWAGQTDLEDGAHLGRGHYYRLLGPRFLAELDDTQNRANHVHTLWRDPDGDHGRDLA